MLLLACCNAANAEQAYKVKLVRPPKVGDRYDVVIDGALLQQINSKIGDQASAPTENGYGVHLEGAIEVLGVNKDGEESKVRCTVRKCTHITADDESALLPPGTVVTAEAAKDKTVFTQDGKPVSDEAQTVLDLALRLADEDESNDDIIYGTKEEQKIGGSWKLDADAFARDAAADNVKVDARDVNGQVKLEAIEKRGDQECMKVQGEVNVAKLLPPRPADLPENMEVADGTLRGRFNGVYPVDTNAPSVEESISMVLTTTIKRPVRENEPAALIQSKLQRSVQMKRTPLPPQNKTDKPAE